MQELWSPCVFASLKSNPVAGSWGIWSSEEGTMQTVFEVCLWADLLLSFRVADPDQQNTLCRTAAALCGCRRPRGLWCQGGVSPWAGSSGRRCSQLLQGRKGFAA